MCRLLVYFTSAFGYFILYVEDKLSVFIDARISTIGEFVSNVSHHFYMQIPGITWCVPEELVRPGMLQLGRDCLVCKAHASSSKIREFESQPSEINDKQIWYMSLPSLASGINRIGQYLVSAISGWCDCMGNQVMVLVAWSSSGAVT